MKRVGWFVEFPDSDPTSPSLRDSIGKMLPSLRPEVARYLHGGTLLATTGAREADYVSGRLDAVPMELRSDGVWAWPGSLAHYVLAYGVEVPEAFLRHIEDQRGVAPSLSAAQVKAALDALVGARNRNAPILRSAEVAKPARRRPRSV